MKLIQLTVLILCVHRLPQPLHAATNEGYVIQWGWDSAAGKALPARLVASNAVTVAAGTGHSLALKIDGTVVGWGGNIVGNATGIPTVASPYLADALVRVDDQILSNVVSIAASRTFSLALKRDGTVVTWGENIVPEGLAGIVAVSAEWGKSWALKSDGTIVGWMSDPSSPGHGQLLPEKSISNAVAIAVGPGGYFTMGVALLRNGTVANWGRRFEHPDANPPVGLGDVVGIAAGDSHGLALKKDGTVIGWGVNTYGQATGERTISKPNFSAGPVRIDGELLREVVSVTAGRGYSLALTKHGTIVAWGRMGFDFYTPVPPAGLSNVVAIAAGAEDFCLAITTNKAVADRFAVPPRGLYPKN